VVKITEDGIPTTRLKAPTIEFNKCFKPNDPKELFIAMNEFAYMLHVKDAMGACFWIEWLFHFTRKKKCLIVPREYSSKHMNDSIWMVWDIILETKGVLIEKILKSVVSLFSIAFVPASKERRRFLIYYAVSLCCDTVNMNVEMVAKKIDCEKCLVMYEDIKKHEIK
jgi:hypothetical protein